MAKKKSKSTKKPEETTTVVEERPTHLAPEDLIWMSLRHSEKNNRDLTERNLKSSINKLVQEHENLRLQMDNKMLSKQVSDMELKVVQEKHRRMEEQAIEKYNELCKKYGVSNKKFGFDPLSGEISPDSYL